MTATAYPLSWPQNMPLPDAALDDRWAIVGEAS